MKLLTEINEAVKLIEEGVDSEKKHYIAGCFMQAEVVNKNKRFYPLPILENEINRYVQEKVKQNQAYGEMGHPSSPTINGDRVAIHIKNLIREGNDFHGKALIASTPMGNIVKGLLSDGAKLGVSSRALGSLKMNKQGFNEVQNDLKLCAVDVVLDPSGPNCFVDGIMEQQEWVFDAGKGIWIEHVDQLRTEMRKLTAKQIEEARLQLFERFCSGLSHSKR